ncbi:hypothetical protein NDU88_011281 [Pleurodeles waltl]|uniref:Uncharacterized protein n=1 Tax=Pleurodeles waltl TaxID=8319 RepID=A0AAV7S5P4_PLEWA|nr:hypothetical protein NDU88_011281 [Pleurodeles waltl]
MKICGGTLSFGIYQNGRDRLLRREDLERELSQEAKQSLSHFCFYLKDLPWFMVSEAVLSDEVLVKGKPVRDLEQDQAVKQR